MRLHLSKSRGTCVPRQQPAGSSPSSSLHPDISGRPAYIRASGTLSTSFFAAPRFSKHQAEMLNSAPSFRHNSETLRRREGRSFTSAPGAPSTPFFSTPLFLRCQAERSSSALLPAYSAFTSGPRRRGAVSTPAPLRRQPPFFQGPEVSFKTSAKQVSPPRPPIREAVF